MRTGAASVALLQRRLRVGYARAGRLIDVMEQRGIISGFDGSKARKVLIDEDDLPRVLGGAAAASPKLDQSGDAATTAPETRLRGRGRLPSAVARGATAGPGNVRAAPQIVFSPEPNVD